MTELISAARLSELVGLIYDCAMEPARWPIAMEAIRAELDFHNATLDLILLPSGTALSNVVCNVPTEYHAVMAGAGPDVIDQWGGAATVASLPMTQPAVMSRVNPAFHHETSTNAYFLAFARPQGIIDAMAIALARDDRAIGSLAFGRHASAGPIGEREVMIAHLLVPHLQRAATINRMLEGAMIAQTGLTAALDTVAVPIATVMHDLTIVHANAAALRLLDQQAPIRMLDGRLDTVVPSASKAVATAVAQAARDEGALGRRGLGIPLIGPEGPVGALHVLPLTGPRRRAGEAVAALFFAAAHTSFVAPTEVAAALFDLTPAEARVFDQLVNGSSQAAIAVALGIERSTVKTHLARLFDKVGVRRQAELVRVAASLAAPAIVLSE